MTVFLIFFIIAGILVFLDLKKYQSKRDIVTYIIFMTIALIFGIFYFSNPDPKSFIEVVFRR